MEIEELAIVAGLGPILGGVYDRDDMLIECDVYAGLEKFAVIVATAEREACAKVCENEDTGGSFRLREKLAYAIRSRSNAE